MKRRKKPVTIRNRVEWEPVFRALDGARVRHAKEATGRRSMEKNSSTLSDLRPENKREKKDFPLSFLSWLSVALPSEVCSAQRRRVAIVVDSLSRLPRCSWQLKKSDFQLSKQLTMCRPAAHTKTRFSSFFLSLFSRCIS